MAAEHAERHEVAAEVEASPALQPTRDGPSDASNTRATVRWTASDGTERTTIVPA